MNPSKAVCQLCGEPMPEGEQMFKYHGYSGPCPKPPIPKVKPLNLCNCPNCQTENCPAGIDADRLEQQLSDAQAEIERWRGHYEAAQLSWTACLDEGDRLRNERDAAQAECERLKKDMAEAVEYLETAVGYVSHIETVRPMLTLLSRMKGGG